IKATMGTLMLSLKLILLLAVLAIGHFAAATPTGELPSTNSTAPPTARLDNSTTMVSPPSSRHRDGNSTEWSDDRPPRKPAVRFRPWDGCMINGATRRCVDVEQSRKNWQTADAQMWSCNHNPIAQRITLSPMNPQHSNAVVTLAVARAAPSDRSYCLDVPGGHAYEGQIVRWWECNDSAAQLWHRNLDSDGKRTLLSPYNGRHLCLDPEAGWEGDRNGQRLRLWRCLPDNSVHQFWVEDWNSGHCGA
ncbi:hypothetical protein BCR44DRAFT_96258, partial [Catenaria anguillulae PL171]